jgi:uncharacterized protein YukE
MANDPNQDGYKDYTDEQLSALPGAPKRAANGGYQYAWRPQAYQDVLGENDVNGQQQLQSFRQSSPFKVAEDDASASAQMNGTAGQPSSAATMNSWTGSPAPAGPPSAPATAPPVDPNVSALRTTMLTQGPANPDPRATDLYNTLLSRSGQSLKVDPNDPIIAGQVNAYRAEQERGARNAIDAQAEAGGPFANGAAMRRLSMEGAARATGGLQAGLMAQNLQSKRDEIAQALQAEGSMLSQDQQLELQRQMGMLNDALQQQQLGQQLSLGNRGYDIQEKLGAGGLNNDLLRTMLQNQQFNANLGSQNDQFAAQLGFNAADRGAYWDAVRNGQLG